MKYVLMILVISMVACTNSFWGHAEIDNKPKFSPAYPKNRPDGECEELIFLGWIKNQQDYNSCMKHIDNPKFKVGQVLKLRSKIYYKSCRFTVDRVFWAHGYVSNKPVYRGTVTCGTIKSYTDNFLEVEL